MGREEIPRYRTLAILPPYALRDPLLEARDAAAISSAHCHYRGRRYPQLQEIGSMGIFPICKIAFAESDGIWYPHALDAAYEISRHRRKRLGGIYYDDSGIGALQHAPGLPCPQRPELPLIIKPRRIDHHDRPYWQQLHGLPDRIGGCSLHRGDDREILAYDGIHQARLAGIPHPEEGDMHPLGGRY